MGCFYCQYPRKNNQKPYSSVLYDLTEVLMGPMPWHVITPSWSDWRRHTKIV